MTSHTWRHSLDVQLYFTCFSFSFFWSFNVFKSSSNFSIICSRRRSWTIIKWRSRYLECAHTSVHKHSLSFHCTTHLFLNVFSLISQCFNLSWQLVDHFLLYRNLHFEMENYYEVWRILRNVNPKKSFNTLKHGYLNYVPDEYCSLHHFPRNSVWSSIL